MTEERRKYHNSISHEEQRIRFLINSCKSQIKYFKRWLKEDDECDKEALKAEISIWKANIKALKKQLPQKLVWDNEENHMGWNCPSCRYRIGDMIYRVVVMKTHCQRCGQKLR